MKINGDHAAIATTAIFVVGIVAGSVLTALAVKTAGIVAIIAAALLITVSAGGVAAAITSWKDKEINTVEGFFDKFKENVRIGIVGVTKFAVSIIIASVVLGVTKGVTDAIANKVKCAF